MSETKAREYKRENCVEAVKELVTRAVEINTGKADYQYYNRIKEIILFGSLVNSDKEKVHDIDICLISEDNRELMRRFHSEHVGLFSDYVTDLFSESYIQERYLKGKRKMFSIHSNVHEGMGIRDVALKDAHICLMSDFEVTEDIKRLEDLKR